MAAAFWTKSKWTAEPPPAASKKTPAIILEALSGKPVTTGKKAAAANAPAAAPVAPDDKDAAARFYKAGLRLLRRPEGADGASGAGMAQVTATEKLCALWLKKCNQAKVDDADIAALLYGQDSLKEDPTMADVDAWIGKIEVRLGAVADVDEWNDLVALVGTPLLLRANKKRAPAPVAAAAGSASAEDAAGPPRTRSTTCKPFHSLLSVGLVVTSFNRDQWDAVVLAMENARFFASEARAMMERADGAGKDAEARMHHIRYKEHMNTLNQLQERALPGLGAFLAEPVLGKRGRGESDDDDASKGGEQEEEEEEEEEEEDKAAEDA